MLEPETPQQQAAEAAAIRRRWITLGEVLAVAAVLISALTFWNSYQERSGVVQLRGLSFIGRTRADAAQARVDALWQTRQPTISSGEKK